jgi:predicted solute-binding protein
MFGMERTTLETIDELLQGAVEDTEDSEVNYRLRTARQLLEVIRMEYEEIDDIIAESEVDDEVLADLRDLGYIE